ncbi:DUF551 domain-containing protein [Escherichia coli]|uniref:DUF551 domain-containing protein n=2 Tax=Enterobacteriaceae TaxID=543 RepID=A0A717ZU28_SALTI|nr:DUF551 domain-containing protein [Escherichia coli]HAD3816469.1 DUF551 domain-containing protein [Salmonella enterica subsp. enterica serovar Typhi str. CT18]HDQ0408485.1 DUF551 domain-containing protein [Salmonella enterica]EEX8197509.1 DUF551 domain-containing protein [Escherichia coli]EEX8211882.1 DUF551 domain-containing protein [Escherichia coli]
MTTITKERIELFIKNPLENGLTRGEQMELARIALASLEADPVKRVNSDQMRRVCLEANRHLDKYDAMAKEVNKLLGRIAPPAPVVPEEATPENVEMLSGYVSTYKLTDSERDIAAEIWNACRTAMLQSGNFRESKNSSTNNFREIAETSTNYPVIPSEVLSAILKVAKIRADFDDFDGDRRGIGDCLDEAEQELIVTINKYASQLAAEPIAPNDVREQTAIPQVPVTPDGWISCSERMPDSKTAVLVAREFDRKGDWRMKWATYIPGYPDANDGWIIPGASWKPSHWMPLPEPPQEAK